MGGSRDTHLLESVQCKVTLVWCREVREKRSQNLIKNTVTCEWNGGMKTIAQTEELEYMCMYIKQMIDQKVKSITFVSSEVKYG